ncbi:HAD family hydrolase [Stomatohabitans albus]|uniref:HAD family hydrolase n=1 Tax=Stomatohabitans albus TaxID=3110766 RepID=UPI00300D81B9
MALPKLIVSDVDGTLLTGFNEVNKRTRDVLGRCIDAGIKVILATGRPPVTAKVIIEQIPHSGIAICANGAITYDIEQDSVTQHDNIDQSVGLEVINILRAVEPQLLFGTATSSGLWYEPMAADDGNAKAWPIANCAPSIEALFAHPAFKLIGWHAKNEPLASRGPELAQAVAGKVYLTWSGEHWVEMSSLGVNKATAVERVCAQWGIEANDVLAFGDMPNDIEMLEWAGTGVAMGNATPDVLAIADAVTEAHYENGVARYLEKLLAQH